MNELENKINELYFATTSQIEKDILIYLKNNLDNIYQINISTVADNSYCSTTSVTRLIKKLGYKGYKEFQIKANIINGLKKESNNVLKEEKNKIKDLLNNIDCIYVYGRGASYISAIYLYRLLLKNGFNCSLIIEEDLLYSLNKKNIIIISNSGETKGIIKIVEELQNYNQCEIFSITKQSSTLSKISNISINYSEDKNLNRDNPINIMNLIDENFQYITKK